MSKDISSRRIAKTVRMREGNFTTLENALLRYIRECARYMKNQALFRADVIRVKALEVRDEIPLDHGEHRITQGDREALQQFKES